VFLLKVALQLLLAVEILEAPVEVASDPVFKVADHFSVRVALEGAESALAALDARACHNFGPRVTNQDVRQTLFSIFLLVRVHQVAVAGIQGAAGEDYFAERALSPSGVHLKPLHHFSGKSPRFKFLRLS